MGKKIIIAMTILFVLFGWLGWYWQNRQTTPKAVDALGYYRAGQVAGWYDVYMPTPTVVSGFSDDKIKLKVYFDNLGMEKKWPENDCSKVYPVVRQFNLNEDLPTALLGALLSGVSPTEQAKGYVSALDSNVKVVRVLKDGGVLEVTLSGLDKSKQDTCRDLKIENQIKNTLMQIPDVNDVKILRV